MTDGMITSPANPQVKHLAGLVKKAKLRAKEDVFLVEGIKMYLEAPAERVVRTYVSESFYRRRGELFEGKGALTVLSDRVFESVSDTKNPQGILCLVKQYHYELDDLLRGAASGGGSGGAGAPEGTDRTAGAAERVPFVMALENLQDPGNLGTIVRTAEGAGATGILLSADCVDLYNPKVIRSTMGSVYRVPFFYAEDFRAAVAELGARGLVWYAAHLRGQENYDRQDYRKPAGFLIGNESKGLTDETAALADIYVRIPMCGRVESLNAAVASSVLMYEVNRQRRAAGRTD